LFPRTAGGVAVRVFPVLVVMIIVVVLVRRERTLVTFTLGLALVVLGLMGVRGLH